MTNDCRKSPKDETMNNKLMYIPNYNKQNNPFRRLKMCNIQCTINACTPPIMINKIIPSED